MRKETLTRPAGSAHLAEVQGQGGPCSVTQVRGWGWRRRSVESAAAREPGRSRLPTVQAPICCLATKHASCQRWRDAIRWGLLFFFWVINQLKSHRCCLATEPALALDASTCPVLDPREPRVSWMGWRRVQGTEGTQASFQPAPQESFQRAWGNLLNLLRKRAD